MDKDALKKELVDQGYTVINEYRDDAEEFFPDHNHEGDQLLIVLEGSIEVAMNGSTVILYPGDRMHFPAGVMHSATIGPEGCFYLDGEKPATE